MRRFAFERLEADGVFAYRQSRDDVTETIESLSAEFEGRIARYEASVDTLGDMPSFLQALGELAGLDPSQGANAFS
jgi:hypothetical protein